MAFQHRHDGFVEALGPVDDHQQSRFVLQTPFDQVSQKATADPLVFRGSLDETQRDFTSVDSHTQGDDDLLVRKALAVEKQGHQIVPFQGALLKLGQLSSRAFHVATRDRRA